MTATSASADALDMRGPYAPRRSAFDFFPGGEAPEQPSVAIVVPLFNEIDHVRAITKEILGQTYGAISSIWLVDGGSDDGTAAEIQKLAQAHPLVSAHANPQRIQAAAINLMFSQETADIVMRLDAHAHYSDDVVERCVHALLRTGAGGVGAVARPMPAKTRVGKSIVAVHESRLGVGVASFRHAEHGCWTDTVWNGCYWRHVVQEVGPYREDLPRTEDNDFNARVRAAGFGLFLDPAIQAYYHPRQTLKALWRQYFATGAGVMATFLVHRKAVSLRHLAPFCLVTACLVPLVLACIWPSLLLLSLVVFGSYACVVAVAALATRLRARETPTPLLAITFATLHLSYGMGSLWGLAVHCGRSLGKLFR